jgi:hypothetical protein
VGRRYAAALAYLVEERALEPNAKAIPGGGVGNQLSTSWERTLRG